MSAAASRRRDSQSVCFPAKNAGIESVQLWEYQATTRHACRDIVASTAAALAAPDDFPPLDAAIVDGDRVALAVDPNVPEVHKVIDGARRMIAQTGAAETVVVVWDEATPQTMERIRQVVGDDELVIHQSDDRQQLCYLAADAEASPIYLCRALVDADFVLPIVSVRPLDVRRRGDLTGIFPALADSATRERFGWKVHQGVSAKVDSKTGNSIAEEVPWLLGVQLLVSVTANSQGAVGEIHAGTVQAIAKRILPTLRRPDPVPPPASLVIAAVDGDQQQQTWENVARAADAAMDYADPEATIVVWSALQEPPSGDLLSIDFNDLHESVDPSQSSIEDSSESTGHEESDELPPWQRFAEIARRLKRVSAKHRVMLYSQLDTESIEPLGLGVIKSPQELANLSRGFESCGVLRAASFAGGN